MLTFDELLTSFRKGFRNGNWRKLSRTEKAFYRACLCYAKFKGKIINTKIVNMLTKIMEILKETPREKILKRGLEKAREMLEKYEKANVFALFPKLKEWLRDITYIEWLGTT